MPKDDNDDKTFTQADIDRIVADRVKREQDKRSDYDELKTKAQKLDELEAANKSDLDKEKKRGDDAERRAVDAEAKVLRYEVAAEKGVKARWLTGSSREELEAAAEEYLKDHPNAGGSGGGGTPPTRKPTEELKGGGDPSDDDTVVETNPAKLAESVPRF